jgi:hypothetical protein
MELSGLLHALATLPWGKSPRYPLDRRLDVPQNKSELYGEEKNLDPAGKQTPAVHLVARRYTD